MERADTWIVWYSSKFCGDSIRVRCLLEAKKMPQRGLVFLCSLGKQKRTAMSEIFFPRVSYYGYVLRHHKMNFILD